MDRDPAAPWSNSSGRRVSDHPADWRSRASRTSRKGYTQRAAVNHLACVDDFVLRFVVAETTQRHVWNIQRYGAEGSIRVIAQEPTAPATKSAGSKWAVLDGLRRTLGLDRAVIFTVLARGWSSLAGLATLFLIAHFLTGPEQG